MDIKAIVFDCDDTLLDSMGMWRSVLPEVLSAYAGEEAAQTHQARAETMGADEGLAMFVRENGLDVDPARIKAEVMERAHWHYANDVPGHTRCQGVPGAGARRRPAHGRR